MEPQAQYQQPAPQIDKSVVNLMKALKQHESGGDYKAKGGSGEIGAYQFTTPTFKSYAETYAKLPDADINNPEHQDKVAYYAMKGMKDKGYTPEQILSEWNAGDKDAYLGAHRGVNKHGVKYDTPAYVEAVKKIALEQAQAQRPQAPAPAQPEAPQPEGQATFESQATDSPLMAGAKTLGNIPKSLFGFTKGLINTLNPVNTVKNIMAIPGAYKEAKEAGASTGDILGSVPGAAYEGLVPQGVRQVISGDLEGAQKSFTEDPIGTVAPVVLAGMGALKSGAKVLDTKANKGAIADFVEKPFGREIPKPSTPNLDAVNKAIDTGMSKTAGLITKPVGAVASKIGGGVGTFGTSIASHLTSLEPATIRQILADPKQFSKIAQEQTSRGGLAGEIKTLIDDRVKDLSETGRGYEAVRTSPQVVQAPNFIAEVLSSKGLKIKNGKILADTNSITRNRSDLNALQTFYNDWGHKTTMTANEFLNMRSDLAQLSKFDRLTGMGKTKASETIGKAMYERANSLIRDTGLPELKKLDETYAPEIKFLNKVKKDYFNADGTFKDNAPSKIANATNKAELLGRLEELMPGIGKRIEILKAVEDIQHAMGIKVGTYTRGVLQGGAVLSGNIPFILATIITHPANAVRILQGAGYTSKTVAPILDALKVIGGDVKLPTTAGLLSSPASVSPQFTP